MSSAANIYQKVEQDRLDEEHGSHGNNNCSQNFIDLRLLRSSPANQSNSNDDQRHAELIQELNKANISLEQLRRDYNDVVNALTKVT